MIHFIFPRPEESGRVDYLRGSMTAYVERTGWRDKKEYSLVDIDSAHLPALQAAIMSIVSIGADWCAGQAWATLDYDASAPDGEESEKKEVITLRIEAWDMAGALRTFSAESLPSLVLRDSAMLDFYKYFTSQNHETN